MNTVSMTARQLARCECTVDDLLRVKLTPHETILLSLLLLRPPSTLVTFEEIIEVLWPDPDTQALTTDKIISVLKYRLKLKGIETESCWGRGLYSIAADRRGSRYTMRRPRSLIAFDELPSYREAA